MKAMTSNRPYLIRAFYDWIVDNGMTPYIMVDFYYPGVQVPEQYVQDGRIVLNISPTASRGLILENDKILFTTRFSGQSHQIYLPPGAVVEIYAKENGRGISFPPEEDQPPPEGSDEAKGSKAKKPSLKLVE